MTMNRDGYDRVTEVLAPFSGIWRVDPLILSRAALRGSRVHALCQGIIDGIEVEVPEELKGYIDSFIYWAKDKNFFVNPGRMFDDERQLTGECDGLIDTPNGIVLFDLKTSVSESCTWKYQGAAYASLLLHDKGVPTLCQDFVKLSKEGKPPKVYSYFSENHIDDFLKCVDLYRLFFKSKNPINEDYL